MLLFMAASSLLLTLSIGWRYVESSASPLGFANRDVLMVGVLYLDERTPDGLRRVYDALAVNPAVLGAARAEMLPLLPETIEPKNRVTATGYGGLEAVDFYLNRVDASFFDVLDVDLLAGTPLHGARSQEVVLSRTAATLFGREHEGLVGTATELAPEDAPEYGSVFTVVGVVEDIPYGKPGDAPRPVVYTLLTKDDVVDGFQDFWLVNHRGADDDIVTLLHQLGGRIEEAYRIATPSQILSEEFGKRTVEAALALAGAFAFALALVGVANALVRAVADQGRQIGIRYALGATGVDEAGRIAAGTLVDLLVVGTILCGIVLAGRHYAPALLAIVTLPLVLVVLAVLAGVCLLGSYASVRHLARKPAISALASR